MEGEMKLEDRELVFHSGFTVNENPKPNQRVNSYVLEGTRDTDFEVRSDRETDSNGEYQYFVEAYDCNPARLRGGRARAYPDTYVIVGAPEEALEAARHIYTTKDQYC